MVSIDPEVEKQSFINPESHKVIYQNEDHRMTEEYDAEYFAWAEELYNSRIIVYSDKGKNLKNTDSIHSCGIIVEDKEKAGNRQLGRSAQWATTRRWLLRAKKCS